MRCGRTSHLLLTDLSSYQIAWPKWVFHNGMNKALQGSCGHPNSEGWDTRVSEIPLSWLVAVIFSIWDFFQLHLRRLMETWEKTQCNNLSSWSNTAMCLSKITDFNIAIPSHNTASSLPIFPYHNHKEGTFIQSPQSIAPLVWDQEQ